MNLYDIKVEKRNGEYLNIGKLKGKVILVVNTATGCGFTSQYEALEKLYKKYNAKGLEVLDFPCNQFGHQAPGNDKEIHEFCTIKYQTTFDQLKKVNVNGDNESDLFKYLKANSPEEYIKGLGHKASMKAISKLSDTCKSTTDIKWNFTKFLIDKEGNIISRISPIESPLVLEGKIKKLLGE